MDKTLENFINNILREDVKALIKDRFPIETDMKVFILTLYDIAKNEYDNLDKNSNKINHTILYTLNNISQ